MSKSGSRGALNHISKSGSVGSVKGSASSGTGEGIVRLAGLGLVLVVRSSADIGRARRRFVSTNCTRSSTGEVESIKAYGANSITGTSFAISCACSTSSSYLGTRSWIGCSDEVTIGTLISIT